MVTADSQPRCVAERQRVFARLVRPAPVRSRHESAAGRAHKGLSNLFMAVTVAATPPPKFPLLSGKANHW